MEQLKDLGFVGIFRESFKNIFKWKKTFLLITLTLLLPLSAMNLAQSKASALMFTKIITNPNLGGYKDDGQWGTFQVGGSTRYGPVALWLFKVIYYTIYLLLSLTPTSLIADTIFAIYTKRELVAFKNAASMVPKVLKRLLITFFWSLAIYFVFNTVFFGMFFIWFKYIWINSIAGVVAIVVFMVLYIATLGYMLMIWQLANVVSVLEEDVSGRAALGKGEALMKGKTIPYLGCFLVILSILGGVHFVFEFFVVMNVTAEHLGTGIKVVIGVACFVAILMLELLRLVNHTVVYFVCKSKHQEDLDGNLKDVPTKRINV